MKEPQNNIILLSKEEAKLLRESQIQRYQHIQSLAQGLLVGGITIIAIVATLVTVIDGQVPSLEVSESIVAETASAISIVPVGELTILVTISLGFILAICYGFMGSYLFGYGLWILFDVVTFQGPGVRANKNIRYLPSKISESIQSEHFRQSDIFQQIQQNNRIIHDQYKKFLNGALRLPTGLFMLGLGSYIYYSSAFGDVQNVIILSAAPLFSSVLIPLFESNNTDTEEEDNSYHTSLNEELLNNNEVESRWEQVRITRGEKLIYVMLVIISFLIIIIWLVAIFQ